MSSNDSYEKGGYKDEKKEIEKRKSNNNIMIR